MKRREIPSIAWRLLAGLFSAVVGIYLTRQYLPDLALVGSLRLERMIAAFIFGAFGYFLVPMLTELIRDWSVTLSARVAFEVVKQLRALAPKKRSDPKLSKVSWPNPLILDTSAIIDGRLVDIVETGFVTGTFLVHTMVLVELHKIADSEDALRRGRGRRGLDSLARLRKIPHVKVVIVKDELEGQSVDHKLLSLARNAHGRVVTTDFNLNKVAQVEGIGILNVNTLAQAVKTVVLPGESLDIKVMQPGKSPNQGVGYLPDGTMVVVEQGIHYVGQDVTVTVARVLQTIAGRMIFVNVSKEQ